MDDVKDRYEELKGIRVCYSLKLFIILYLCIVQDIDGSGKLPPIVVVGNKCDLEELRVVSQAEGEALSKSFGPSSAFMEASAKANIGIDNVS